MTPDERLERYADLVVRIGVNVDGLTADGDAVPVIRDDTWVLDPA